SGVLDTLISKLSKISANPILHVGSLTLITAILSAFMNNVGALAMMMPTAIKSAQENKRSPAIILMPLALGSALGGLTTLIGTPPNLLISAFRQQFSGKPFTMFDFSYVGLSTAIIGIVFITLIGWRLMPKHRKAQ